MNLKKSLVAAIITAGAIATPALADLNVRVGIGVPLPPPAMIYDPVPPPPAYGYVWAPGSWAWNYNRYLWVRGRYIAGRPGYAWAPERWEHRGDRYHFVSSDWRRDANWRPVREERREPHGLGHAYGHTR